MAKYKARPFYSVRYGAGDITFGLHGDYETNDAGEIKALDALCPRYIRRIDEPEKKAEVAKEAPAKAEEKPKVAPKRKANAKPSAK